MGDRPVTKIGIVGCGYVFDHYMSTMARNPTLEIAGVYDIDADRMKAVTAAYGVHGFPSCEAMLARPDITIIVNLTPILAHAAVTRAALEAGKHVYSEKPFVADMTEARELIALAESRGLSIGCAPSNMLSATSQTLWKIVKDGALGDVRLVYAEFDDNPIYLMSPEAWRSRSGAPWPYLHEYEMGCTWEHVGYHLAWMLAIFGPVRSVTAFSRQTIPDKTTEHLDPADTPDFSVACLDFANGVVGRITCSIAAPFDHRMRIIGNKGMAHADTYRHYECPVYLEHFSKLTLNARKARSVRTDSLLQRLLGVGGRRVPLVTSQPFDGTKPARDLLGERSMLDPRKWLARFKRSQLGQQDKTIGIAALAHAIENGEEPTASHAFTLHLTELTLAIQAAGPDGRSHRLETRFEPRPLPDHTRTAGPDYARFARPRWIDRMTEALLDRMHRH
jgi:predicted dehydrogenase